VADTAEDALYPPDKDDQSDKDERAVTAPSRRRRLTIEELVEGMTPEPVEFMEDDWPVGDELI
jgi:hypothetical protein